MTTTDAAKAHAAREVVAALKQRDPTAKSLRMRVWRIAFDNAIPLAEARALFMLAAVCAADAAGISREDLEKAILVAK